MTGAVEARSLSDLTWLAENPPRTLQHRARAIHEPIVLYIARVPGNQDVFLTPLKPRSKVVSAEDVESCLFYCHVDGPEDERMLHQLQVEAEEGVLLEDSAAPADRPTCMSALPPRPLPPLPIEDEPASKPRSEKSDISFQHPQSGGQTLRIVRKPIAGGHVRPQSMALPDNTPPLPPRHEPNPKDSHSGFGGFPYMRRTPPLEKENVAGGEIEEEAPPPPLPPHKPSALPGRPRSLHQSAEAPSEPSIASLGMAYPDSPVSSLTLIRRDPGSGQQWNVAKISMPSRGPEAQALATLTSDRGASICMTTPAYEAFVDNIQQTQSGPSIGSPFQRWVSFESRDSNGRQAQAKRDSLQDNPYQRRQSADARSPKPSLGFQSPWNGFCEFHTGLAGRSLKCRHYAPFSRREGSGDQGYESAGPRTVSELRFNLPSAGFPTRTSASQDSEAGKPRHMRLNSSGSTRALSDISNYSATRSYDESEEEEERMDLSLGQEKAGGGHSGKKAKLGKLIVEGDGFLMLDLIVAANLSFWWSLGTNG